MHPNTPVVFCQSTNRLIDFLNRGETAEQGISRLAPDYGDALIVVPVIDAHERYEASFKTPVSEITAEDYDWLLNCLPPVAWSHAGGAESFKMSERTAGNVTTIVVKMRGRFFKFSDLISLPHAECCQRVSDFLANE